jgi:pimeloyl-ACP methyl ester carboxylesterase
MNPVAACAARLSSASTTAPYQCLTGHCSRRRTSSRLSDERRYDVPVTVIACEFPSTTLRQWMEQDHPYVRELSKIHDVDFIDLPTGHWPQLTRPADLGETILSAVGPLAATCVTG